MLKLISILGARPQFIKAATVSRALRVIPGVHETLVHTGQHYDDAMSAVFFRELEIPEPEVNLEVGSGPHGAQTGRMLERLEELLIARAPDRVLIYGDTNSTLAGALAAAKLRIPVAHVEAGLRSFNRAMPEEINRIVADHLADLLFAPTTVAVSHLRTEGIPVERVLLTGDVMYDAALHYGQKAESESTILQSLGLIAGGYVLATVHRAENTDDPARLTAIFHALENLAAEVPVVVPVHPRTRNVLGGSGSSGGAHGLRLIEPVGYLDMTMLERHARLIATDSGGVQKEAFFHGVPCVTLRTETEWTELVESGWNRLAAPTSETEILEVLRHTLAHRRPEARPALYGQGDAAIRIARALVDLSPHAPATVA